jgi:hypothetical protein
MQAMKNAVVGTALAGLLAGMSGCIIVSTHRDGERLSREEAECVPALAPGETLPSVESRHAESFAKLRPGMSVDEFKAAFPSAVFVKQQQVDGEPVDAYRVSINERLRYRSSRYAFTHSDSKWFYFRPSGLVYWGASNQWKNVK